MTDEVTEDWIALQDGVSDAHMVAGWLLPLLATRSPRPAPIRGVVLTAEAAEGPRGTVTDEAAARASVVRLSDRTNSRIVRVQFTRSVLTAAEHEKANP